MTPNVLNSSSNEEISEDEDIEEEEEEEEEVYSDSFEQVGILCDCQSFYWAVMINICSERPGLPGQVSSSGWHEEDHQQIQPTC